MKYLIASIVLLLSATTSFAQSRADYDAVMAKFQRYYNEMLDDSMRLMYSDDWRKDPKTRDGLWPKGRFAGLHKEYGTLISFKYAGEDEDGSAKIYKIVQSKSTHPMGILLDKHDQFVNFRFHTTSDQIEKLIEAVK